MGFVQYVLYGAAGNVLQGTQHAQRRCVVLGQVCPRHAHQGAPDSRHILHCLRRLRAQLSVGMRTSLLACADACASFITFLW